MKQQITSVSDLGALVRATRNSAGVRLDDLASTSSLSKQFVNDVELGKPGAQLGKVLQMLKELGIQLYADVPDTVASKLAHARNQIDKTTKRRKVRQGEFSSKDLS